MQFWDIVHSPLLLRLQKIKQLSYCFLAYPSANHTRYEHSIGVAHLTYQMILSLFEQKFLERDLDLLHDACAAGLLHDIGHGALGHVFEVYSRIYGEEIEHEDATRALILDNLKDLLEKNGFSPTRIFQLLRGQRIPTSDSAKTAISASTIISSDGDVDRLDYLRRDSLATGVPYGSGVDIDLLIRSIRGVTVEEITPVLIYTTDALPAVESLLVLRDLMYATVYNHPTNRAAQAMLARAIHEAFLNQKNTDKKHWYEIYQMNDYQIEVWLAHSQSNFSRKVMEHLGNGSVFNALVSFGFEDLDIASTFPLESLRIFVAKAENIGLKPDLEWLKKVRLEEISLSQKIHKFVNDRQQVEEFERKIKNFLKTDLRVKVCDDKDIIFDIPKIPTHKMAEDFDVKFWEPKKDGTVTLSKIAPELFYWLNLSSFSRWKAYVFAPLSIDDLSAAKRLHDFTIREFLASI